MEKYRIMLAEDEITLARGLMFNLEEEGYDVFLAEDGKKAVDALGAGNFDLVILDIMLPYYDGFQIAEKIREKDPRLPVLMLTARGDIKDKLKGLETGADDYMVKPFHLEELLLRIKGMLKRKNWYATASESLSIFRFGNNSIDFLNLKANNGKDEFALTLHEAMLLKFMIEKRNTILSRKEILENVWNISPETETRTIDIFISRFRKYFEKESGGPEYFKTVRGAGYVFSSD